MAILRFGYLVALIGSLTTIYVTIKTPEQHWALDLLSYLNVSLITTLIMYTEASSLMPKQRLELKFARCEYVILHPEQ